MSDNTIQVYSVYIKAPAAKIWQAITTSEYTKLWGYGAPVDYGLTPGAPYVNHTTEEMRQLGMGDVAVTGTVIEVDEPTKLVLDWAPAWHPESKPTRITWELTEYPDSLTRVTLTHDLTAAPEYAGEVAGGGAPAEGGGGWLWCLSGLKTLLETGKPMDGQAA